MMFSIKIADTCFEIHARYPDAKDLCHNYICKQKPNTQITISADDIAKERAYNVQEALLENHVPLAYTDGALETTAIYRKIADYFSHNNGAVMHGALIALDEQGILFTAPSGTGKTTHINNWTKCFSKTKVINGDKPILRIVDGKLIGYGTPWSGKEGMNINSCVPLKAIVALNRANSNNIEQVSFKDAFPQIMSAVYRPKDAHGLKRAMQFVKQLSNKITFYKLGCTIDAESAQIAYEGLFG